MSDRCLPPKLSASTLTPSHSPLEKTFKEVLEYLTLHRRYIGTLEQRIGIWQFSTVLISRYVDAIAQLRPTPGVRTVVDGKPYPEDEIRMLEELIWHYVVLKNELAILRQGQTQAVRIVVETMLSAANNNQWNLFPPAYHQELGAAKGESLLQTGVVVDSVAGMTKREMPRVYSLLIGRTQNSLDSLACGFCFPNVLATGHNPRRCPILLSNFLGSRESNRGLAPTGQTL